MPSTSPFRIQVLEMEDDRISKLPDEILGHIISFSHLKMLLPHVYFQRGVPVFTNLTHLEIFFGILIRWTFVFYILDNCPKLQDFLLDMPLTPNIYNLEIFPNILTQCLSLDFKSCTITNYRGEKDELRFVQLMLMNSISLESMRLNCLPSLNSQEKLEMQIELLAFPRSFVKCVVYVE